MQIIIQSPHIIITEGLYDFVKSKVGKLGNIYEQIELASVFLRIKKQHNRETRVCEIRLTIPGNDQFAEKYSNTFEEAAETTIDALKEQLQKPDSEFEGSL
ncbi:MAG: HPF/RaiA family ribosome-associated protein [Bacteroidota bacterium]